MIDGRLPKQEHYRSLLGSRHRWTDDSAETGNDGACGISGTVGGRGGGGVSTQAAARGN